MDYGCPTVAPEIPTPYHIYFYRIILAKTAHFVNKDATISEIATRVASPLIVILFPS